MKVNLSEGQINYLLNIINFVRKYEEDEDTISYSGVLVNDLERVLKNSLGVVDND